MINAYHSIVSYAKKDWKAHLDKLTLTDIFEPLLDGYKDMDVFGCAIKYIVWCYSVESDRVIMSQDWQKNKQNIFEAAMVQPRKNLYEDLVLLKNKQVLSTVNNWIDFQDSDTFKMLSVLKDLRVEMQISCLSNIVKASGEVDYDQKFKNAGYANELKVMIKDLESELVQNNQKLKEAVREVKNMKSKYTVGPETFSK